MTHQNPSDEAVQEPTFPQYTNLALSEGLFDQLMKTVQHHLDTQFEDQRIRGSEYAKVYLGSMEAVLTNTTQYLLGQLLIDEQKSKMGAETSLIGKNEEKIDGELLLIELERLKLKYEVEHLMPLLKLRAEKENLKIDAEILLITAQISLAEKQEDKIDQEILFLIEKVRSESANTQSGVAAAGSLIGKQMSLLTAQKLGFAGDIQMKGAKLYADYDAVFQTVQEVPGAATLGAAAISAIGVGNTTAAAIAAS